MDNGTDNTTSCERITCRFLEEMKHVSRLGFGRMITAYVGEKVQAERIRNHKLATEIELEIRAYDEVMRWLVRAIDSQNVADFVRNCVAETADRPSRNQIPEDVVITVVSVLLLRGGLCAEVPVEENIQTTVRNELQQRVQAGKARGGRRPTRDTLYSNYLKVKSQHSELAQEEIFRKTLSYHNKHYPRQKADRSKLKNAIYNREKRSIRKNH